jgi:hypothetical protein
LSGPSQRRLTVDRTQQSCRTCIIDGAACSDACGVRCTACVRCGAERWPLVDSPACGSRQLSHGNETRTESLTQQHALLQQPTSGKLLLLALKSVSRRAALDVLVPADNHQVRDCLLRSFNHVAAAPPLGESKLSRLCALVLPGAVVAMAKPRRTQRVSQQIMRELSLLMLSDKRVRCFPRPNLFTASEGVTAAEPSCSTAPAGLPCRPRSA